ncbi:MAG: hypothetical protein ACI81T_000059 [Bacteroidia bacterium]
MVNIKIMKIQFLHIKLFFLAFAISYSSYGKEGNRLLKTQEIFESLIQTHSIRIEEPIVDKYKSDFLDRINLFKQKKEKSLNDEAFLEHLFYKVHRVYLKKYKPYQSFEKLFEKGEYGCLTGTALYALILEELGYQTEIRETNYHIFLIVQTENQRFLIESTDPLNGFLASAVLISKRLKEINSNSLFSDKAERYEFKCKINRKIRLEELIGLQYYNVATQYYNRGYFELAIHFLHKSRQTYQSGRQKEFFELILSQSSTVSNTFAISSK